MKNDIVSDLGYKKRVTLLGRLLLADPTTVGSCSLLIIPLLLLEDNNCNTNLEMHGSK